MNTKRTITIVPYVIPIYASNKAEGNIFTFITPVNSVLRKASFYIPEIPITQEETTNKLLYEFVFTIIRPDKTFSSESFVLDKPIVSQEFDILIATNCLVSLATKQFLQEIALSVVLIPVDMQYQQRKRISYGVE